VSGRTPRAHVDAPLYRQVCESVEDMAMNLPLGDERPFPTEPELMAVFGVSRGTVRRAIDELVRGGLLRIEAGRGTFVIAAEKIRRMVWDHLVEVARPDSRFDLDISSFVPDFDGSEKCAEAVRALDGYTQAATVFITPDNSLETLRSRALGDGKTVIVPTYGLRRGFVQLDGQAIPLASHPTAATLDGMERHGRRLSLADLRQAAPVGLVVTGAVAVTVQGLHVGSGTGYFDLEWGLLRHLGLATPQTRVAAVVHPCQIVDAPIRPAPHDAVVDTIVTPDSVTACQPRLPKPDGLFWDELRAARTRPWAYVDELLSDLMPAATFKDRTTRRTQ
jgi:5-formyltetrahydrofolate cyclo-ligase